MEYSTFTQLISAATTPVILLEGTRDLPPPEIPRLTALAAHLARSFPEARFRSGNAKGSAFAAGVASVDPSRLEFVVPYAGHRGSQAGATAIDDVPPNRFQEILDATLVASPQYRRVAVSYRTFKIHPRQRATAQLILRDTLKVTGNDTLCPPLAGIFFVHAADPERGGTGHTIRVCRTQGVPVITQFEWFKWPLWREECPSTDRQRRSRGRSTDTHA